MPAATVHDAVDEAVVHVRCEAPVAASESTEGQAAGSTDWRCSAGGFSEILSVEEAMKRSRDPDPSASF